MNETDVELKIKTLVSNILLINPEDITNSSGPKTIDAWKGKNHSLIIESIEKVFGIVFEQSEIDTFVNFKIIKSTVIAYID